jgi:hypothetical protein
MPETKSKLNKRKPDLLTRGLLPAKQLGKGGKTAACLQEFVGEEFVCGGAGTDVNAETDAEEGFEFFGEFLWFLQARGAISRDEVKGLERFLVQVGGFRFDHFNGHDTQGPAIDLGAVFFLLDNFGGHPVGGADHGGALILGFGELGTEAEISDFDVADTIQEDVVRLDISVDDVLAVEMG